MRTTTTTTTTTTTPQRAVRAHPWGWADKLPAGVFTSALARMHHQDEIVLALALRICDGLRLTQTSRHLDGDVYAAKREPLRNIAQVAASRRPRRLVGERILEWIESQPRFERAQQQHVAATGPQDLAHAL